MAPLGRFRAPPKRGSATDPGNGAAAGEAAIAGALRGNFEGLEPLAIFLCGPRWQTALARRINRSPRLVRRWVAGDRPISIAASQRIIALVVAN